MLQHARPSSNTLQRNNRGCVIHACRALQSLRLHLIPNLAYHNANDCSSTGKSATSTGETASTGKTARRRKKSSAVKQHTNTSSYSLCACKRKARSLNYAVDTQSQYSEALHGAWMPKIVYALIVTHLQIFALIPAPCSPSRSSLITMTFEPTTTPGIPISLA